MCYDYSRLSGKIVEKYGTQYNFAIAMKLSERSLSLKLNGKVGWKDSEIWKAIQLLDIPVEKIHLYFFKRKSSCYMNLRRDTMEQITLTKEECVEQCINKDLKLLDYRVQQILEGVLSESTTYGDARNKLETLKIIAESHFKTEHASVIYKLALKKLDEKINATPIKE